MAFWGSRCPADVIPRAVRWSRRHPRSTSTSMALVTERGIDISRRTLARWVQACGPLLAAEVRTHHRPLGARCSVEAVFIFRGEEKGHG
jgi:transposase-like protein